MAPPSKIGSPFLSYSLCTFVPLSLPSLSSSECVAIAYSAVNDVHILWLALSCLIPPEFDLNLSFQASCFSSLCCTLSFVAVFFQFSIKYHMGLFLRMGIMTPVLCPTCDRSSTDIGRRDVICN